MSSPLAALNKFEPGETARNRESVSVVALNPVATVPLVDGLSAAPLVTALGNFKYAVETRDYRLVDYLLLGVLSIFIHGTLVERFKGATLEKEIVEPVKLQTKVQITLARPQPKPVAPPPPPPKVQAKPPTPKVVPLKPQKPKPVEKLVEQAPAPDPAPVVDNAPTTPAPPAPPAPVVEEKVTAPKAGAEYLNNPQPAYPEIASERGWEGKVLMKVHVQPDGKPDSVNVIKTSGHDVLDDAAVKTVKTWSFVPAMRGSTPVDGWVTVPITFNLS